ERLAFALPHNLKESGVVALLHQALRLGFHRTPPGVRLHATPPSAHAARAALLDHHVADLPRIAAAVPELAVERHPSAHAGSPEYAQQRASPPTRTEPQLRVGGHRHVVAQPRLHPEPLA